MIDPDSVTRPAQRLQAVMTTGAAVLILAMMGLAVAMMTNLGGLGMTLADMAGFGSGPLKTWQSLGLSAVVAAHIAVWIILFALVGRVFGHLADGDADAAAGQARRLSYWLWGMLMWGIVSQMIVSVVATWGFGDGQRELTIGLGTAQISIALSALIAGFMARAFALGAELWRDHREMV
ncbi:MAG: hypothetical protein AAF382_18745 [Pseudomonadota bacterium]